MAPFAHVLHTSLLKGTERHGIFRSITTLCRVTGLTDTGISLFASAFAVSGVPAIGDTLAGYSQLVLTERNPTVVNDKTVDIELLYEEFDNEGQSLDLPPFGFMTVTMEGSVQQVKTNLDSEGIPVTVEHTYKGTDPTRPNQKEIQGGEFEVFIANRTLSITGIKVTNRPWLTTMPILGKLNSNAWVGGAERTWLCTRANYKVFNPVAPLSYTMLYQFEHNPDSWDPDVIFIDPKTGKAPEDLEAGVGYKKVQAHKTINFENILGFRVNGG